jgi:hypothetical protein
LDKFFNYAGFIKGFRAPHPFAELYKISNNNLISDDCIICPGHEASSFGMRMPLFLTQRSQILSSSLIDSLFMTGGAADKCDIRGSKFNRIIRNRIKKTLDIDSDILSNLEVLNAWEEYIWKTRQSSHILSDVKAYDYFEYECWFPLLDRELLDFWPRVYTKNKKKRSININYINKLFEEVTGSYPKNGILNVDRVNNNQNDIKAKIVNKFANNVRGTKLEYPAKYLYYLLFSSPQIVEESSLIPNKYPEFGFWSKEILNQYDFADHWFEYRKYLMLHLMDIIKIDEDIPNVMEIESDIRLNFEKFHNQSPGLALKLKNK